MVLDLLLVHTFMQFAVYLNNSCSVVPPCTLSKAAVILYFRQFSDVWCIVAGQVLSLAEFKAVLLVVFLALHVCGGFWFLYRGIQDAMFNLHVSAQIALQVELAGAVRTLEGLAASMEVHVAEEVVHSVEGLAAYLAFERLDRQVDDHVCFEGLLLDEGLEADVALEGPDAGVDQHVPLQIGGEGELSGTHVTFELFHTLVSEGVLSKVVDLDKLHAALWADIGTHVLVLHQVVLQLAAVGERLVALRALEGGGALVAGLVAFEVGVRRELHATL